MEIVVLQRLVSYLGGVECIEGAVVVDGEADISHRVTKMRAGQCVAPHKRFKMVHLRVERRVAECIRHAAPALGEIHSSHALGVVLQMERGDGRRYPQQLRCQAMIIIASHGSQSKFAAYIMCKLEDYSFQRICMISCTSEMIPR